MQEREITLTEILTAREERVAIQNTLLSEYKAPVISFTMNIAGPVKVTALSHRAFLWGMEQLRLGFIQNKMKVLKEFSRSLPTGDEGYFAIDAPAERVKALCVEIEDRDADAAGRLYDMDVIGFDGKKLERDRERYCIVCGKPGRDCASRRLHSVAELQARTRGILRFALERWDTGKLGELANRALLEEVAVTPKPGLVDRANNGAHRDMDYFSFQASAAALRGYWARCFLDGYCDTDAVSHPPAHTFRRLRPLGKQAERDMLAATGGVNTHKGAIFTLGVLCGAVGRLWTAEGGFPDADAILDEAAAMTRETLEAELPAAHWNTAGEEAYRRYGTRGIRGEVADGLPAVRELSLPVFRKLLADGLDRNHAAAVTLLHLIARVEDTNLLHRGGPEGAKWARAAVGAVIGRPPEADADSELQNAKCTMHNEEGTDGRVPSLQEIAELDRQFIERKLSPGGCADLLAVTLFLESLSNLN